MRPRECARWLGYRKERHMIGTRTLSRNRQARLAAVLILGVLYVMIRMGAGTPNAHAATQGPTCHGLPATIVGTAGADHLWGTPGRDVIVGLGGGDVIHGRGGNDVICGNRGADLIFGGAGADELSGGDGNDTLEGGGGADDLQ